MGCKVAVVGATGAVGRELLQILSEREFPADDVVALASKNSAGREVSFGEDDVLTVRELAAYDFKGTDIALFSAGGSISKEYAPRAAKSGCVVIDNTSHFRMDPDVPLVVSEVNPEAIDGFRARNIIANPNCSTMQLAVALKPLHERFGVRRVVVSTYQAASGAGMSAMDELFEQTKGVYANAQIQAKEFTRQIAFNAIPHIDVFMDGGDTKEEWKMSAEIKKIVDSKIKLHATCVRIAVFIGHGEAVNVELARPVTPEEARKLWQQSPGISVFDRRVDAGYVTPVDVVGEDPVYISRVRTDPTVENGLAFWCVADNLRKGAALNAVQIAELLVAEHLEKQPA